MLIAWIAILSLFDIIATGVGVSKGIIQEGNPIVAGMFEQSLIGSLTLIALIIGLALWIVETQIDRFRWIRFAMFAVLFVKLYVACIHLLWIGNVV